MKPDESLRFLSDSDLVARAQQLARKERTMTAELLRHLHEIEKRRIHFDLGYPTLHRFVIKELGYSDGCAQHRISAMRLMMEVPEARSAIEKGSLPLSTASVLQGYFNREDCPPELKSELVVQMQGLSRRACERRLAARTWQARERAQAMGSGASAELTGRRGEPERFFEVKLLMSQRLRTKLERVREVLGENGSLEQLIEKLADGVLLTDDSPVAPEVPGLRRTDSSPVKFAQFHEISLASKIPASLRRQVWSRAERRCEYPGEDGERCGSRVSLQVDFLVPRSKGGEAELSNLRLLCREHVLLNARRGRSLAQVIRD